KSSRFGSNKLQAPIQNISLGSLALQTAMLSKLDKIIVVTKPNDSLQWLSDKVIAAEGRWIKAECKHAEKGLSYSLRCGLKAAEKLGAMAIVVMLADQPFITKKLINDIIYAFLVDDEL